MQINAFLHKIAKQILLEMHLHIKNFKGKSFGMSVKHLSLFLK